MAAVPPRGRDWVAIILAVGFATAVNAITIGVLWTAIAGASDVDGGLSENATQVLVAAFGGLVGILGGYFGFKAGQNNRAPDDEKPPGAPDDQSSG